MQPVGTGAVLPSATGSRVRKAFLSPSSPLLPIDSPKPGRFFLLTISIVCICPIPSAATLVQATVMPTLGTSLLLPLLAEDPSRPRIRKELFAMPFKSWHCSVLNVTVTSHCKVCKDLHPLVLASFP